MQTIFLCKKETVKGAVISLSPGRRISGILLIGVNNPVSLIYIF
jgi:hypothetical protein